MYRKYDSLEFIARVCGKDSELIQLTINTIYIAEVLLLLDKELRGSIYRGSFRAYGISGRCTCCIARDRSINSNPFIGFAGDVARRTRKRNEPRTTTISLPGASSSRGYHLPLRTRHFIPLSLRGNAHFLSLIFGQPFCICYFIQAFHAAGVVTKCEMFMHAKIKRTYRVAFCDSSHYPKNQFLMAAKWTRSGLYFYWFWCS